MLGFQHPLAEGTMPTKIKTAPTRRTQPARNPLREVPPVGGGLNFFDEWRPVKGFEKFYRVSKHGRIVRSGSAQGATVGFELKQYPDKEGYLYVRLSSHNKAFRKFAHSLVAEAFIGTRPSGQEINHRDGNKANNSLSNLEYVTHRENMRHYVTVLKPGQDRPASTIQGGAKC